jgi:hypothetical protein
MRQKTVETKRTTKLEAGNIQKKENIPAMKESRRQMPVILERGDTAWGILVVVAQGKGVRQVHEMGMTVVKRV